MSFSTIYTASTGMLTFSKGLSTVSNNVANLNTPGFKRSDLLFRDLFYQFQQSGEMDGQTSAQQNGAGVTDAGTITSFAAGDIQQTGNSTDVAISGNGFFILREPDQQMYTRAGQFEFDSDGFLSSTSLGSRVAGIDASNNLVDININQFNASPAVATSEIVFSGILSTNDTTHQVTDVNLIDTSGSTESYSLTFTDNTAVTSGSWLIDVNNQAGTLIADDLEIRFSGDSTPQAGFNEVNFVHNTNTVTLKFGDAGSITGATSLSSGAASTLAVDSQDGLALGSFLDVNIGADGVLEASYSNGETADVGQLALAWFSDLQSMRQIGNGIFLVSNEQQPIIGKGSSDIFGDLVGGSIEISNVELTQEFTDLIIIQRGFQASSQIMSASNEMIQELLSVGRGG
ncbi:Flagellar hook protein FlgE [gamma proteobacterium IMCC1989]|nr:Flagellar hook protein FlgE [gamma proteobacterium IMCC1989]